MMVEPYPHLVHGVGENCFGLFNMHDEGRIERHCRAPSFACEAGALAVSQLVPRLWLGAPISYDTGHYASRGRFGIYLEGWRAPRRTAFTLGALDYRSTGGCRPSAAFASASKSSIHSRSCSLTSERAAIWLSSRHRWASARKPWASIGKPSPSFPPSLRNKNDGHQASASDETGRLLVRVPSGCGSWSHFRSRPNASGFALRRGPLRLLVIAVALRHFQVDGAAPRAGGRGLPLESLRPL